MNYFAFLRGINVGGHNMLRMADLKALCTSLGYDDVRTVLQSGNVIFLDRAPIAEAAAKLRAIYKGPEIFHVNGREMYVDYVNGAGRSKLTNALIERTLGVTATARNWNTVTRLLSGS